MYKVSIKALKQIKSTLKASLVYREVSTDFEEWIKKCKQEERNKKKIKKLIKLLEEEYGI